MLDGVLALVAEEEVVAVGADPVGGGLGVEVVAGAVEREAAEALSVGQRVQKQVQRRLGPFAATPQLLRVSGAHATQKRLGLQHVQPRLQLAHQRDQLLGAAHLLLVQPVPVAAGARGGRQRVSGRGSRGGMQGEGRWGRGLLLRIVG